MPLFTTPFYWVLSCTITTLLLQRFPVSPTFLLQLEGRMEFVPISWYLKGPILFHALLVFFFALCLLIMMMRTFFVERKRKTTTTEKCCTAKTMAPCHDLHRDHPIQPKKQQEREHSADNIFFLLVLLTISYRYSPFNVFKEISYIYFLDGWLGGCLCMRRKKPPWKLVMRGPPFSPSSSEESIHIARNNVTDYITSTHGSLLVSVFFWDKKKKKLLKLIIAPPKKLKKYYPRLFFCFLVFLKRNIIWFTFF